MIEAINQHTEEEPLDEMKDLTARWANYFKGIQQMLDEYERLQQRVAALESENAALTDTVEQWKNNDEWSNRVTYDNVVDQIASLEDASKRDENNQQKAFYYVLSAKAAVEASKADPVQAGLDFETGSNEEWHDGDPF